MNMDVARKVMVTECAVCGVLSESNLVTIGSKKEFRCKHHTPKMDK